MNYIEATVWYDSPDGSSAVDIIADVFIDSGLTGIVINDEIDPDEGAVFAAGLGFVPRGTVTGFYPLTESGRAQCRRLELSLTDYFRRRIFRFVVSYNRIEESAWDSAWRDHFHVVKIGPRLVIRPSWRSYQPGPDEVVVTLDPGMAFGTGNHPTTALCLSALADYLKAGDRVLDIGTGSGILAVAALKLGAGYVLGIDVDEPVMPIARNNLFRNDCPAGRFDLVAAATPSVARGRFSLVITNIYTETIIRLLPEIDRRLLPGGRFICSGIMSENRHSVVSRLMERGYEVIEVRRREGWIAAVAMFQADSPTKAAKSVIRVE